MTGTDQAVRIAASLSEAQRRYLTTCAEQHDLWREGRKRWCTFPPVGVHRVLHRLGLVLEIGLITESGMEVKRILEQSK